MVRKDVEKGEQKALGQHYVISKILAVCTLPVHTLSGRCCSMKELVLQDEGGATHMPSDMR